MPWLRSLVVVLFWVNLAAAADWPQWLGPNRDGTSPEKVAAWQSPPRVLWRKAVGEGHSSPVVAGGRVFLLSKVKGKDEEAVQAFDVATGNQVWRTAYPKAPFTSLFGNGPRATPAVVDGRLYTYGVTGLLSCFKADSGAQVWQVDTLKLLKASNLFFGVSSSPLVDGQRVLVDAGGSRGAVVAFDVDSGKVLWKADNQPASYSSPILIGKGKDRQAVFLTQRQLVSLDADGGQKAWDFPLVDALNESSATPVHVGDLIVASTVKYGSVGLRLEKDAEGKPAVKQAWKNPDLACYFSTPVAVGKDDLYMVTSNGNMLRPEAALRCVAARTGKERWHRDRVGKFHAALIHTGNNKLLLLEDSGTLVLLDPNPRAHRELARAKVCGEVWAHPALADGKLYVRDGRELICLQLSE
jgi:outer membrane protein assembly factor BamB